MAAFERRAGLGDRGAPVMLVLLWTGWGLSATLGVLASIGLLGRWSHRLLLPAVALFVLFGMALSYTDFRFAGALAD